MSEQDRGAPRACEIVLELFRASKAGNAFAFALEAQDYVRRMEDGALENAGFPWSEEALGHIEAIQREKADPAAGAWLGEALRAFLVPLQWEREEARIARAVASRQSIT